VERVFPSGRNAHSSGDEERFGGTASKNKERGSEKDASAAGPLRQSQIADWGIRKSKKKND